MPERRIEVVCALAERQHLVALSVPAGTTVDEAVTRSGVLAHFPQLGPASLAYGIFGHVVEPTRLVEDGDRVEIYRPLRIDPKQARRERARSAHALRARAERGGSTRS